MQIRRLQVTGLRCLSAVDIYPGEGLSLFLGANGAGKTSVIEAAYALGSGKSFRFGGHEALIARDSRLLQIYAELDVGGMATRVGFERQALSWRALANGDRVPELSQLAALVPVVCFSPESHELIGGASEVRRRFFDWIVFHVEPEFPAAHRRYSRTLKQRNILLKQNPSDAELATWTRQLANAGEELAAARERVLPSFQHSMQVLLGSTLAELDPAAIVFKRGWKEGSSLAERLESLSAREREVGYTLTGPHRADWTVEFSGYSIREQGSRGQQKLVALAAVLAAAQIYRNRRGEAPLIALDDLFSELDVEHQRRALRACEALRAQTWITGTQGSESLDVWGGKVQRFHVEHGQIHALD